MIIRFAKLGLNNEVEKIDLVEGSIAITENEGIAFLQGIYNHTSWKQSYTDGTRKNAAGKGMKVEMLLYLLNLIIVGH